MLVAARKRTSWRRHGLLPLLAVSVSVPCLWLVVASVLAEPSQASQAPDGGVIPAAATGRPVCVRVGTRSEGWAWPSGRFIHWAKCKGVVPKCQAAGPEHDVEGWYGSDALIAPDACAHSGQKHR